MDQLEVLNNLDHGMSKRYKVIPTQAVIDRFIDRGFTVQSVQLPAGKNKLGPHLVRLSRPDLFIDMVNSDLQSVTRTEQIEVIITNSYNGGSSLKINLGIYRFVCSNGLMAGTDFFKVRIPHVGNNFYDQVDDAIAAAIKMVPRLRDFILRFKLKKLTPIERALFAEHCFNERLKGNKNLLYIDLMRSLNPVRSHDLGDDLWTVLNIIQEKVIRGGIYYTTLEGSEPSSEHQWAYVGEHNRSRAIKSISEQVRLNEFMFDAALKIAA